MTVETSECDYRYPLHFLTSLGDLLLNRQVKSYNFLSGGEVSIDNMDDAEEYKATWVRVSPYSPQLV